MMETATAGKVIRVGVLVILGGAAVLLARKRPAAAAPRTRTRAYRGADAVRFLISRRDYPKAVQYGYRIIWRDLDQPEVMFLLGAALERAKKPDDAATIYALLLRTLEGRADPRRWGPRAAARLKAVDKDYERQKAAYVAAAAGRKFDSPQAVDDGWMLAARCDLFSPYCLGCWPLVGRRAGVPPDWIHNREGKLHRSGAKFISAFDGRKGLLYTQSIKDKPHPEKHKSDGFHADNLARLGGHPPQLTLTNFGACPLLRVGIKAEQRPIELRILVDGKRIFAQRIDSSRWWDLKIPLPAPAPAASRPAGGAAKPAAQKVILELACPEDQQYSGCVWIDYADFFVN